MADNPFSFGDPIKDSKFFVGRQPETTEICTVIRQASSVSIVGERRIGKSSLLFHVTDPDVAKDHGLDPANHLFARFSFEGHSTIAPNEFWRHILESIKEQIPRPPLLKRVMDCLAAEAIGLDDIDELLRAFGDASVTLVVALDEFDIAAANANFNGDFFGGLRGLSHKYRLSWLIASHKDIIDLQYAHQDVMGSPFFNFLRPMRLTGFTDSDLDKLLNWADVAGVRLRVGDRAFIERFGGHHPYFVQAAAHYLYTAYSDNYLRASQPDEKWVLERLRIIGHPQFSYYWKASDNGEKVILATLALIEQGDVSRNNLDRNIIENSPSKGMLRRLYQRALLEGDREGRPRIFSNLFSDWIVDEMTFIASNRLDDFERLVKAIKVDGSWEQWIDRAERFRRGFAWVDTRAIVRKVLVEKGPEVVLDMLNQIIMKILFPSVP